MSSSRPFNPFNSVDDCFFLSRDVSHFGSIPLPRLSSEQPDFIIPSASLPALPHNIIKFMFQKPTCLASEMRFNSVMAIQFRTQQQWSMVRAKFVQVVDFDQRVLISPLWVSEGPVNFFLKQISFPSERFSHNVVLIRPALLI